MNKKIWKKPELIVITRARSGEMVLARCKGDFAWVAWIAYNACFEQAQAAGAQSQSAQTQDEPWICHYIACQLSGS